MPSGSKYTNGLMMAWAKPHSQPVKALEDDMSMPSQIRSCAGPVRILKGI